MTTAHERVRRFVDTWKSMGSHDPETIYGLWVTVDGRDRYVELSIADLEEVLNERQHLHER